MELPAFASTVYVNVAKHNPSLGTCSFRSTGVVPARSKPTQHAHVVSAVASPPASTDAATATEQEAAAFDAVVMGTYTRYNIVLSHGEGALLYDVEGRSYVDGAAGIATCTLGHAHKGIQEAVTRQLGKLAHVSNLYYTSEQRWLASWLVQNSPADKAFFCNSGGEANEAAIKLVRRYWHNNHSGRENDTPVIICAKNAFHGRTLATITATGQPKYQRGFWPLVDGFVHCTYNDPESLRAAVEAAGDRFAGVLFEALQGEGGVNPGTKEFFSTARKLCDERDALMVCDEVQVGMGRSGKLFGFENVGVEPDAFTLAKGLAGGIPIGAMLCKNKCAVFGPGDHASTFGGNLVACAAGRVVAEHLESGLLDQVLTKGAVLDKKLQAMKAQLGSAVKDTRGWGLIRGIELSDSAGVTAGEVVGECIKRGVLLVPAGTKVVRIVPPLVVTETQLDKIVDTVQQVIADLSK